MKNKIHELYALERLSNGNTSIHRLHPAVKLITSAVFIVTVVSFDRYALGRMIPYVFYPTLLMAFSETPYSMLLKRFLIALPFCLFAGISNLLFDREPAFTINSLAVSLGVVSLLAILLKAYLCVMAVLILMSVTPFSELTGELRRLKTPGIFVILFEMTYRYMGVLFDEAHSMYVAYSLRSAGRRGIEIKDMGSFVGQLLLRSFDRAERVYAAMQCRGYAFRSLAQSNRGLKQTDLVYGIFVCALCIGFRLINLNAVFRAICGGGIQ